MMMMMMMMSRLLLGVGRLFLFVSVLLAVAASARDEVGGIGGVGGLEGVGERNASRPSSLTFAVAERGLTEIEALVLPELHQIMMNVTIPDIKVEELGIVVEVSNITLTKLDFGSEAIDLSPPNVVTIAGTGVIILANMNWRYHDGLIKIHGTAKDVFNQTSLNIAIALTSDHGHLGLTVAQCDVNIKDFAIILDGGAGGFYQDIVNMLHKPLEHLFSSTISTALVKGIDEIAAKLLPAIPLVIPLSNTTEIDYGLINVTNTRGMSGFHYSDNHFSGTATPIIIDDFDISIGAYESIDIAGFFQPATNGTFYFQIHFNQAGEITAPSGTAGHLEMHNPGMCWVEHHTDSTPPFNGSASVFYPIQLQYQGGCGGGHIELRVCAQGGACQLLSSLNITTNTTDSLPVFVDTRAVMVASGAEIFDRTHPQESAYPHHTLPTSLPATFNSTRHSLVLYLDPFLLNSGISVLNTEGAFNLSITNADLPPAVLPYFQLNTTFFRYVLPNLYQKFPNDAMQVDMEPSTITPITVIPNEGIGAGFLYSINVSVLQGMPSPQRIPAMTLEIEFAITGNVSLANTTLTGAISAINLTTTLKWSIVPVANISALNPIIAKLLDAVVIPALNSAMAKGLPLPTVAGLQFANTDVVYEQGGYIALHAAFHPVSTPQQRQVDGDGDGV
ncbi:hypothetical protein PTSG_07848 [Salpingoeca rosetta]|uniref:Lipid-binding serum glycoprotein C-terminal domain-containing protein n=1 Tax=Salpingoeca rosetta (strain ATCC 50818 / BSB-021) TaxID=946362 RepID=F2UGI2_SALR5|nr:uncharacterized protein PTSG_07848 [Salpingoeca rosetta]EGD75732.1 hypothetical protein PTSG_07848 [Salpingoeca rosetta]|eukprot:XP_004991653.1 hypothetical protein PTSG_07848 [Salpingoeca rosetta]